MPPGNDTVIIGIGEYQVGSMPMASIGLGSCVGLVIHDRQTGNGALVHIMLPSSHGKTDRPGKYADSAIEILIKELTKKGRLPFQPYCEDSRRFGNVQDVFRKFKYR